MNKKASIIFGKVQNQFYTNILAACDIIYAEPNVLDFINSNLISIKHKTRLVSSLELSIGSHLAFETLCHLLSPFIDYSTYVIATSDQIKPEFVAHIISMPHIKKLFYQLDCKTPQEASSAIMSISKFAKENNHQFMLMDSKSQPISQAESTSSISFSNSFISLYLKKS